MKQQIQAPIAPTQITMSHSTTNPSRFRLHSDKSKVDSPSPSRKPDNAATFNSRKSVPPDVKKQAFSNSKQLVRRSMLPNNPNSGEEMVVGKAKARPGRREQEASDSKKKGLLQEKLQLIKELQSQILALKAELDKAHSLNHELESLNKKLAQDLAATQANNPHQTLGECQSPNFKHIENLISNKLQQSTINNNEIITSPIPSESPRPPQPPPRPPAPPPPPPQIQSTSKAADRGGKAPLCPSLPPPPPPPPPQRPLARAATAPKTPPIVEFYHSLRKQEDRRGIPRPGDQYKPAMMSAHSSIVGEIQNRSAHLLAIKADIQTKGDFINGLIQKVQAVAYTDIEDVLKFVDWLDGELSSLADERAVLRHFNWPEKKADAIREAAIEYRGIKLLENEISSYKDDTDIPCRSALKKMAALLDKSEQSIQRLVKLRNLVLCSYRDLKIPTDWMLDSGIICKIKEASMRLAKMYMKRVIMEVELTCNSDRESNQEALLLQGVHFAYRAYQFAGGLDPETMCAFEEMKQRVPSHLGGSRELLAAILSR